MVTSSSTTVYSPAYLSQAVQGFEQLNTAVGESAARLLSGNRIIQMADDAAAVSVAAGLSSQAAGFNQATTNASAGSSLLEVAAGALQQISDIVANMQTLAQQSAITSTLAPQRAFLQAQFAQSMSDIDAIANNTSFNGVYPLTGFTASFQVGAGSGDTITISIGSATSTSLFGGSTPDISSVANATAAETSVTNANNTLQGIIDYVAGAKAGFDIASGGLLQAAGGNSRAGGNLINTNIPAEQALQASNTLKLNTSSAILSQATNLPIQLLSLLTPILPVQKAA